MQSSRARQYSDEAVSPDSRKGKQDLVGTDLGIQQTNSSVNSVELDGDVHSNPGPQADSDPSYFYANLRSILGTKKLRNFNSIFNAEDYDIIAGTETWLKPHVYDGELLSDKYILYKHDRPGRKTGGGVLLAISSHLRSRLRPAPVVRGCEHLWLDIDLKDGAKLLVGIVYIPPNPTAATINEISSAIAVVRGKAKPKDSLLLFGDFNLPNIKWHTEPRIGVVPTIASPSTVNSAFLELIAENDLVQYTDFPTRDDHFSRLAFV